jgi:hypothetical protein
VLCEVDLEYSPKSFTGTSCSVNSRRSDDCHKNGVMKIGPRFSRASSQPKQIVKLNSSPAALRVTTRWWGTKQSVIMPGKPISGTTGSALRMALLVRRLTRPSSESAFHGTLPSEQIDHHGLQIKLDGVSTTLEASGQSLPNKRQKCLTNGANETSEVLSWREYQCSLF